MMFHRRSERGAASVVIVACAAVLLLVGCGLSTVAATVVAHRRAQLAADLAALAGAGDVQRGGDGCTEAGRVATANQAALRTCRLVDADLVVEVSVTGPRWLGLGADLDGHARAGPGQRCGASVGVPC
ncbi:Rv3654c family TadE-like protein [Nocardioides sp.]|uniref:Rv3654c family TadE-like protein n=1 Tax=Nocardioides sp. TaxID=35761 RepID=UPI002ED47ECA